MAADEAAEGWSAEITGTVHLTYRDEAGRDNSPHHPPGKICTCCGPEFPGHVFGIDLALPDFGRAAYLGQNLDDWLQVAFPFKELEGRQIRITAVLLDGEATTGRNPLGADR
jgi:hypothetical protein